MLHRQNLDFVGFREFEKLHLGGENVLFGLELDQRQAPARVLNILHLDDALVAVGGIGELVLQVRHRFGERDTLDVITILGDQQGIGVPPARSTESCAGSTPGRSLP